MSRILFEQLAQSLATRLGPHSFERVRERFYRDWPGGEVLVLDLERHRHSDESHLKVRVGVSMTCETIARFLGGRKLSRRPKDPEFGAILGEFFHRNDDAWWLVEETPDPEWQDKLLAGRGTADEVANKIATVVASKVLPSLAPFTSDTAIRDHVLAGGNFGRWGVNPFLMAVLTAKHGPAEAFECYAERTLTRSDWSEEYYKPLIERLRRGDFFAPGFAPGEKGVPVK